MSYIPSDKYNLWPTDEDESLLMPTLMVLICVSAAYWWLIARKKSMNKNSDSDQAPWAPGGIPVLGHALSYRKDPPGFLVQTRRQCGPVFRLNLAGKEMIIVCGPEEQRQLANLPESVLSLRKAVGAIGFEQTLGYKNVHTGTQIHKGIVKAIWNSPKSSNGTSPADEHLAFWQTSIRESMKTELAMIHDGDDMSLKINFFHLMRRVILRATIEVFIGKSFLQDWESYDFLKEFMDFQDTLEEVTAKVVVVPRWLALVAMLWPLQRRRERLQLVIQRRLESVLQRKGNCEDNDKGIWLREVLGQNIELSDIAEYIVGLLFAAHKNPAIGSSQSYLLLREFGSEEVLLQCQKEASILVSRSTKIKWSQFKSSFPTLRRACLESLRLTAHTIGGIRTAQKDLTVLVKRENCTDVVKKETVYRIPKESSVAFAHITSSLDSSVWGENAANFDPNLSRYSDEPYMDDYKFTTFSNGVHKCPGRELAMILLKLTMALLLTEYDVGLPEKISPLDFERATLAQREGPVMVSIVRRQCPQK